MAGNPGQDHQGQFFRAMKSVEKQPWAQPVPLVPNGSVAPRYMPGTCGHQCGVMLWLGDPHFPKGFEGGDCSDCSHAVCRCSPCSNSAGMGLTQPSPPSAGTKQKRSASNAGTWMVARGSAAAVPRARCLLVSDGVISTLTSMAREHDVHHDDTH